MTDQPKTDVIPPWTDVWSQDGRFLRGVVLPIHHQLNGWCTVIWDDGDDITEEAYGDLFVAGPAATFVNENRKRVAVAVIQENDEVHIHISSDDSAGHWTITPTEAQALRAVLTHVMSKED